MCKLWTTCGQAIDGGGGVLSACKSYGCLPPTGKAKMESESLKKSNTMVKTSREDKSGTREKEAWSSDQDDYPAIR